MSTVGGVEVSVGEGEVCVGEGEVVYVCVREVRGRTYIRGKEGT